MSCHLCKTDAVTRCHTCGELICEAHGGKDDLCTSCSGGFVAGDPRISEAPLGKHKGQQAGWWRPQEAEEYIPPACYECQSLSRVCRNCLAHYCRQHAGANGLCKGCTHSANLGLYVMGAIAALMAVFLFWHWISG